MPAMALTSRSARLAGGRGWILAGVVLTIVVLFVDASIKSRSPAPVRQLAAQVWIDRVLPVIADSSTEGAMLEHLRRAGSSMSARAIVAELEQVASQSAASYKRAVSMRAPASLRGAAGFLDNSLMLRSKGAAAMAAAMRTALSSSASVTTSSAAVSALATAGNDLHLSDRAYRRFASNLFSRSGVKAPSSVWVLHKSAYSVAGLSAYLASLRSSTNLAPVQQVGIVALSTKPSAESQTGSTEVLPTANAMSVTVVVADTGNQVEKNLIVTASISPSAGTASAQHSIGLQPGAARAVTLGPLHPPSGRVVTLSVSVAGPAGAATPSAHRSLIFRMPKAPAKPSTTAGKSVTTSGASHS